MQKILTKDFALSALSRAVKTAAQVILSMLTVGAAIDSFQWPTIISIAATSFVYSILTSIVFGLPENNVDGTFVMADGAINLKLNKTAEEIAEASKIQLKVEDNLLETTASTEFRDDMESNN